MQGRGITPAMPPPGPAAYLLEYFWDIGPSASGGMGPTPLTWAEIQAWQHVTGTPLRPWEARTLRRLSHEYINTLQASADPAAPAPYAPINPDQQQRAQVARTVGSIFGSRARANR